MHVNWYCQWLRPSRSHVCKISWSLKPEAWSLKPEAPEAWSLKPERFLYPFTAGKPWNWPSIIMRMAAGVIVQALCICWPEEFYRRVWNSRLEISMAPILNGRERDLASPSRICLYYQTLALESVYTIKRSPSNLFILSNAHPRIWCGHTNAKSFIARIHMESSLFRSGILVNHVKITFFSGNTHTASWTAPFFPGKLYKSRRWITKLLNQYE